MHSRRRTWRAVRPQASQAPQGPQAVYNACSVNKKLFEMD